MPNIVVTIKEPPGGMVAEKLRMALGLLLDDGNKVSVLFADDGVYTGLGVDKANLALEIDKPMETMGMLGGKLYACASSAKSRGVEYNKFDIGMLDDEAVSKLLRDSETIVL